MATEYVCGKCGGTDWYTAVQVMNSGSAGWFTKRVEVATCRKCDVTMRKVSNLDVQLKNSPYRWAAAAVLLGAGLFLALR
jgi:hypothetical protein